MGRSYLKEMRSYSDIEKGDVKHGVSSSQEKMTPENSDLANPPSQEEESTIIFKVRHRLREVNEKAYEPNVIPIGPYHYRKAHLARMEDFKKWWFENFVQEPHLGIDQFREAISPLEEKIRNCYEQPLSFNYKDEKIDKEEFVDMMVYDGCFVVQLILEDHQYDFRKLGRYISAEIFQDLLLLENQLPFFVLLKLYSMINPNPGPTGHFNVLATSALNFFGKDSCSLPINTTSTRHLLDLVHSTFQPSEIQEKVVKVPCCVPKNTCIKHLLRLVRTTSHPSETQAEVESSRNSMPSATELEDAGIHLLSVPPIPEMQIQEQWKECMFGITFDKGTKELKIPTLQVDDFTERFFRNYMAYEQFLPSGEPIYFVDYVAFIDDLINTSKDVELLRKSGIIDNLLGNDEAVTQMFNKLGNFIHYSPESFYYNEIANQVNDHCKKKWNIWKAKLKKDYFHTPWSPISFLAALVLLLLTILQTTFSILSYNQQRQLDY
ncbi:UPF0481 protein At3g47200 isoform X2 [Gossypium raimondii]|uniref:Uncharacterized protein n=2 Tax=Gossypium raimondii TaxID=29730 RepID=A0A0D2VH63_GOSRA|nr:UPF0481 protein At3g47200 isoform X2 [Gossypium raimondii]XP_052482856.1 UPF0481 protein At3g47200 isoform X2 [Gossypium raimondii]KJB82217.1 hypothetical protein B456_013G182300 [Gossypium raimondii]KJB82218.1 hypothetical protein B456_013G182300 [Gossypium raimondii]KJB82219.1 hypothetical protein B456_013G182300 [Gossypium raimondii]